MAMAIADNTVNNLMVFAGIMTFMVIVARLVNSVIQGVIARKGSSPANLKAIEDRLSRIEQVVETSALEIERIGEGQRFTTKVLTERAGSPVSLPHTPRNTII